jgi:hypothetical protein
MGQLPLLVTRAGSFGTERLFCEAFDLVLSEGPRAAIT